MSQGLKSRVWVSQGLDYTFPEQCLSEVTSKPNIGVCFSGGGTRAMTAAMGQLRALDKLGIIPKIRYISCVSGGSWASTIYTYYKGTNDAELLGPVTRAQDITKEHVKEGLTPTQLAYGATKSLVKSVAGWEFSPPSFLLPWLSRSRFSRSWFSLPWFSPLWEYTSHDVWNYAIGQTYLEDHELFDSDVATKQPDDLPYFSYDETTINEIKQTNPDLSNKEFLKVHENRPFLIVNSCVLLPQDDPSQDNLISFEYTPLTVGRPHLTSFPKNDAPDGTKYGGGFIEPFAYRGGVPNVAPEPISDGPSVRPLDSTGWVNVPQAKRHYSLTETTGTSSSAFAKDIITTLDISRFTPEDFYWAVNGMCPYTGKKTLFGDGGLLENNGIIPLIQRGVELAIVFTNADTKLDPHYFPTDHPHDEVNDPNGHFDVYIPSLFGYSNSKWEWYYPNNQIFPTSEFKMVLNALKAKLATNEPLIVTCQHTVLQNDSWGVKARQEKMLVTWCYLDRCAKWEANLGCEKIRQDIIRGNSSTPEGPYENFPNYKTMFQNGSLDLVQLTKEQVTLMADFTCDCILLDSEQTIQKAVESVARSS
ncbi:MAG: patatin-like phospholipase family protein [Leptolyngbyaceae cyanobacterium MAG.088]|nr:patatin-like phospholipase family protein [Leptolyngbyaceae cyanobacterium MAG.088]